MKTDEEVSEDEDQSEGDPADDAEEKAVLSCSEIGSWDECEETEGCETIRNHLAPGSPEPAWDCIRQ